jgi:hypothetical protein
MSLSELVYRPRWLARLRRGDDRRSLPRRLSLPRSSPAAREPFPSDPRLSPDFDAIGRQGSHFLTTKSSIYIRRHVETIQIKTASFGRRRLTIDVQLPTDPDLGTPEPGEQTLFWVPVTSITKTPARSNIDLLDDQGNAVPLLNRDENAAISYAAAIDAAERLLGRTPPPLLADLIHELINREGVRGDIPFVLARAGLASEGVDIESGAGAAFVESLRVLAGNSCIWVSLTGRPGDRRLVKFHYDIEFPRVRLRRERPKNLRFLVYAGEAGVAYPLDLPVRGDGNPYSLLRRLGARIAAALALGAVDFGIETPYIRGSDTYHLQVSSPPGVETRDINLLARLEPDVIVEPKQRSHGVHLYLNRVRLAPGGASLAVVTLRVGRRGFMTLSWLSALLTAALLWLFYETANVPRVIPETRATVLLFGPALLAALVVRPGEHPVATKLFSGVRVLVSLNGLLAVAAAAAVAGVRPDGMSLEQIWLIYAICASVVAGMVSLSWLLSWDSAYKLAETLRRRWRSGAAYRGACALLLALLSALLLLSSLRSDLLPAGLYLGFLVALVGPCAFASTSHARLGPSESWLAWFGVSFATLAAGTASLLLTMNLAAGWSWKAVVEALGFATLLAFLALAVQALADLWRIRFQAQGVRNR